MKVLEQIENKIDTLTDRVNDLTMNYTLVRQESWSSNQELNESEKLPILKEIGKIFENHFLQIETLLSIYNALPNLKFLPSTRGWAGSPDFLNKIVEIILKHKPRFVLEASSGVSTVLIGLALKMNNFGKSYSFEHNTSYAEITRKNIDINDIKDISIVMDCPLIDYIINDEIWKWYETKELIFPSSIDLLIIDGPPRETQNLARYPAIQILHKYFSDNVFIILDDANRYDEIIVVEKWIEFLEKNGFKINIERNIDYEKGIVILNIMRENKL